MEEDYSSRLLLISSTWMQPIPVINEFIKGIEALFQIMIVSHYIKVNALYLCQNKSPAKCWKPVSRVAIALRSSRGRLLAAKHKCLELGLERYMKFIHGFYLSSLCGWVLSD